MNLIQRFRKLIRRAKRPLPLPAVDPNGPDACRCAPPGQYRVVAYDQYDHESYPCGDFETVEGAIVEARKRASVANAIPTSFSDIYFVYDHKGQCYLMVTFDDLNPL